MDDLRRDLEALKQDLAELKNDFADNKRERQVEIAEMRADIKQLLAFANMGQGVMWTILRIGAVVAIVGSALAWAWDHINWK